MMIREIKISELSELSVMGDYFKTLSAHIDYSSDIFITHWTALIKNNIGVIFIYKKDGKIAGMVGGVKHPDINDGSSVAMEMFWAVLPSAKGRGIALLNRFELWAKDEGCKKIIMVRLIESMPEYVGDIYRRKGYAPIEEHFIKEL